MDEEWEKAHELYYIQIDLITKIVVIIAGNTIYKIIGWSPWNSLRAYFPQDNYNKILELR